MWAAGAQGAIMTATTSSAGPGVQPAAEPPDAEELTVQECWHLLGTEEVGRLAVSVGHHPDVFPVNYAIDTDAVADDPVHPDPAHHGAAAGRSIVLRTEGGTKLAGAVLAPEVAFEVDRVDADTRSGWSVVCKGRAEEVTALGETERLERLGLRPWAGPPKTRWVRIRPFSVTGRRVGPGFDQDR
jgi:nitroimidazol reductase NimA-like FMN-containing flavoprotein (pyridoxamine 5'-phosphate oxidase superfamily)